MRGGVFFFGIRVVSGLLAAIFIFAGLTKLSGMPLHVEHFATWRYPDWFRLVVGVWEVVCGLLLVVPSLAYLGAAGLTLQMAGAVYTHLFRAAGEGDRAAFALVLLVVLATIAWVRRPGGAPPPGGARV